MVHFPSYMLLILQKYYATYNHMRLVQLDTVASFYLYTCLL
jgi:hypothetical protein